jgi:DNA-binding NarL/FixJ family response regulator
MRSLRGRYYYGPSSVGGTAETPHPTEEERIIPFLTARQIEALGRTEEIAEAMGVSVTTVKHHIRTLARKRRVRRRGELAALAGEGGLVEISSKRSLHLCHGGCHAMLNSLRDDFE